MMPSSFWIRAMYSLFMLKKVVLLYLSFESLWKNHIHIPLFLFAHLLSIKDTDKIAPSLLFPPLLFDTLEYHHSGQTFVTLHTDKTSRAFTGRWFLDWGCQHRVSILSFLHLAGYKISCYDYRISMFFSFLVRHVY